MSLDFDKQLEMVSVIDQLLYAKKWAFDPEVAVRLRELIGECDLRPLPSRFVDDNSKVVSSSKIQGYAAGFGNVSVDQTEEREVALIEGQEIWAGKWAVQLVDNGQGLSSHIIKKLGNFENLAHGKQRLGINITKGFENLIDDKQSLGIAIRKRFENPENPELFLGLA